MDNRENIQKQIRDGFENAYKERMLTMKNFYQMRYQTLQQTISNSYKKVLQDQILTTMIRDTTTVNYLQERVKQLFKQIVQNQREVLIQKLGLQYSQLKFHYQQLEKKFTNFKKESQSSIQRSFKDRISSQTEKFEGAQALRKKDQQIFQLKIDSRQKISVIKQKERIIEQNQNKINELKQQNILFKTKLQEFGQYLSDVMGDQNTKIQLKDVDLKESQKKLTMLQNKIKEIQKTSQQKIQLIQKKYRKKIGQYKQKIQQYKAKILQLINQRPKIQTNQNYELRIQEFEKKIVMINRQAEKKINQLSSQKEKDRINMQKKYENKYKQLQAYYQKLVQQKIEQSQKVAYQAAQRIKAQEQQIKKYIQFLQQNSSPVEEYNKLQKFCENLKQHLENKILQNQQMSNYFNAENKQMQLQYEQTHKYFQEAKNKIQKMQNGQKQAYDQIKSYEQQLYELRTGQKKLKSILINLETNMKAKQQQNIVLRNQIQKIRSENTQYIGTIGQRQNLFLQKVQQVQQMQKRIHKLSRQLQMISEQKQKNEQNLHNLKRNLVQKQNGLHAIVQENQFKTQTLNSQLYKNNLTIEALNQRIKQFTQKCSNLQNINVQVSRQKNQLQTAVRRLQLQNKFVKQSQQAFRRQHDIYILDYKKKIQQKDKNMEELNNTILHMKKVHIQQNQIKQAELRKLNIVIKKVHRIYYNQMDNLKRNLKDIKIYAESSDKLLKSQMKLLQSNTNLKLKQQMLGIISSKNQQIRKIKQNLQYEKNQQISSTKQKSQQVQTSYKQKLQAEIRNYMNLINSKDRQIERMQKQMKKCFIDKDQLQQINRSLQKKIKDIQLAFQNEKIQSKSKINEIIRTFDSQKSKIMQDSQLRRQKQQNQLQELTKMLKSLRKQLDNSKSQIQTHKNQLIFQTKEFNKKEKQLQKQLQRKKLQLDSLNQQLNLSKQSVHKLDSQLKLVIDRNKNISQSLAQSQLKNHQVIGEFAIMKARVDRLSQQNQQVRRQLMEKQSQSTALQKSKKKMQTQLRQIKSTINKSNKSHDLRALQQLDLQTKQLTNKVSQIRKFDMMISQDRTPLRS